VGGKFILTSVNHLAYRDNTIGCVSYANLFNGTADYTTFLPQQQAIKPRAALTTAIVTDNDDPNGWGRIKVQFLRSDQPIESDWIRFGTETKLVIKSIREQLINPEEEVGQVQPIPTLPDIDDEVIVGFLGGDPDKPIALGFVRDGLNASDYKLFGR